ncbi:MAG: hypothetical protein ACYDCK_04455 [Thermoplasmatota archaeon]
MTTRVLLDNSDDNLCFGCGPENPMGLRLQFYHEGDQVTTEATPTKWWSGQPGVVNPGILYAVLADGVIWAASALDHRVPLLEGAPAHELGGVSTKKPFTCVTHLVRRDGPRVLYRAEIAQDGKTRAWMEQWTRSVTRAEYREKRPLVEIPASLEGYFEGE